MRWGLTLVALAMAGPWTTTQAAGDALLARSLAATCANCHGTNGQAQGDMRPLAGMPAQRLTATLADYRNGSLAGTIMPQIAKGYTEAQIQLIASYFAAQKPAR